jgi:hypothetical protein
MIAITVEDFIYSTILEHVIQNTSYRGFNEASPRGRKGEIAVNPILKLNNRYRWICLE